MHPRVRRGTWWLPVLMVGLLSVGRASAQVAETPDEEGATSSETTSPEGETSADPSSEGSPPTGESAPDTPPGSDVETTDDPAAPGDEGPEDDIGELDPLPPEELGPLPNEDLGPLPEGDNLEGEEDFEVSDFADMSLEDLLAVTVVTATKTERRLSEAPAIVTVLTRQDMLRWGYDSLGEALNHMVGFYIVDDHILPNAGVRGIAGGLFDESRGIKVMIDGHSVAFRSTSGNWLGPELIPISAIERIEIIRGPSSALYGADAFLGVVNVITRTGEQLNGADVRAYMTAGEGREPGLDVDITGGARSGPFEIMLSARIHESDRSGLELPSSSPAPQIPDYHLDDDDFVARGATGEARVVQGRATYHFNEDHKLSLVGHYSTFNRGAEFSPWTHLSYGFDSLGRPHSTRVALRQASVGLVHESSFSETAGLTIRGFYFYGEPTSEDRIDVGSSLFEARRDFGYQGVEGSAEGRFQIIKGLDAVTGVEVISDRERLPSSLQILKLETDDLDVGDVVEAGSTRQGKQQITNLGLFAQALWTQFEPGLTGIVGVRYDYHSIYGGQASARVGVTSNPVEKLSLKLLYGTAFKAPSPLLLYGTPYTVGDIIGNPELEPERIHTVEGQVTYNIVPGLVASTGLSYSRLLNKAEFVQLGVNRLARNLSDLSSLSWETEINAAYDRWVQGYLRFELPYTVRSQSDDGYQALLVGEDNVIYPTHTLRAGVTGQVPGIPLRLGAEVMYIGDRRASAMNILENGESYELDSYVMLDATLSLVGVELIPTQQTMIQLKVRNILDENAVDPGFTGVDYPVLGRSFQVKLRQEF